MKYLKSSNWKYSVGPYFVLLFLHLLFVTQAQQPWIWPDEFIQLSYARYLAGGEYFFLSGAPHSHFGYSLLILPAFWFFQDPLIIYKAIAVINAILASALYFPIYYILRQLFSPDKKAVAFISFSTCLYPAFFVQTNMAWQESVLALFYMLSLAAFINFIKKTNYTNAIFFASLVGFLYMMHARVIVFLLVTIFYLVVLFFIRRGFIKKYFLAILIIALFFWLTNYINKYFLTTIWHNDYLHYPVFSIFKILASWTGLKILFLRSIGQLIYLWQATYGLFFVALFFVAKYIISLIKDKKKLFYKNEEIIIFIYILLSAASFLFVSFLFIANQGIVYNELRPDHLVYGRYNELFLPIFIALALFSFYKHSYKINIFLIAAVLVFSFILNYFQANVDNKVFLMSISGIYLYFALFGGIKIFFSSLLSLALFLLLYFLAKKNFNYLLICVLSFFLLNILINYLYFVHVRINYSNKNYLATYIEDLGIDNIYYDRVALKCNGVDIKEVEMVIDYNFYNYQWQLPNLEMESFKGKAKSKVEYEYIISSACWNTPGNIQAEIVQKDNLGIQAIWKIREK